MRQFQFLAVCTALSFVIGSQSRAGDLTPPPGPVDSTMKPLDVVEPRTPVQSLPGGGTIEYVISAPGSYYLTGPINASVPTLIAITAPDVTLDLMGYTIRGTGNVDRAIHVAPGIGTVKIRNGRIRSTTRGIVVEAKHVTIEDVEIQDCSGPAIEGDNHVTIRRCAIAGTGGVNLQSFATVVETELFDNSSGLTVLDDARIERCRIISNAGVGVKAQIQSRVVDCEVSRNATGIDVHAAAYVRGCTINNNTGMAIIGTNRSRFVGNSMAFNQGGGILLLASGNIVAENSVFASGSPAYGSPGGFNLFIKNTAAQGLAPHFQLQPSDLAGIVTNPIGAEANDNISY